MAVEKTNKLTTLSIRVEVGSGDNVTYKKRTFNHINPEITDEKLLTHAKVIGAWQSHTVNGYIRQDTADLSEY